MGILNDRIPFGLAAFLLEGRFLAATTNRYGVEIDSPEIKFIYLFTYNYLTSGVIINFPGKYDIYPSWDIRRQNRSSSTWLSLN